MKMHQGWFNDFNIGLVTGIGVSLAFSLFMKLRRHHGSSVQLLESLRQMIKDNRLTALPSTSAEYKMVMVVNTKLKMEKGKVASQCAHAAVSVFTKSLLKDPCKVDIWQSQGSKKIVVKADDNEHMERLQELAHEKGLTTTLIRDRGLTQITPGSQTVLGIGPDEASLIGEVVGSLKLY